MTRDLPTKGSGKPIIDAAFDHVTAALQQLHQAVSSEQLPADFVRLLDDIDAKIAAARAGAAR